MQRQAKQFTRGPQGRQQGFTLIEVMIALLFVAMGIVTVIEVTSSHVNNITELEKRILASWVASNKIAEMRHNARTNKVKTGGKNDSVKMGGMSWRRAEVKETEVERVFLVTVEVRDDKNKDRGIYASVTTALTDRL